MDNADRKRMKNLILKEMRGGQTSPLVINGMILLFEAMLPDQTDAEFPQAWKMVQSIEKHFDRHFLGYWDGIE